MDDLKTKLETPDFDALRAKRNAEIQENVEQMCRDCGWDPAKVEHGFNPDSCYCACPEGPCEHDFQGWRDFEDGTGGEAFCSRCGTGAMRHSLMTAEF